MTGIMIVAGIVVFCIATSARSSSDASEPAIRIVFEGDHRSTSRSVLDRALYEASEGGEVSDIEQLLNAGANVNCALQGDGSPLIGAAREGHSAAIRLLLDRGADPNMPVSGDGNPLIMAAREGHSRSWRSCWIGAHASTK